MEHRIASFSSSSQFCTISQSSHKRIVVLWICYLVLACPFTSQVRAQSTILFHWIFEGDTLACVHIPNGFKESQWKYGEGIITTLTYPDSSFFSFQYGVDMSFPLLTPAEHIVFATIEKPSMNIRLGRLKSSRLFWCEETFKTLPISIAFSRVPHALFKVFKESLSTFRIVKDFKVVNGHK